MNRKVVATNSAPAAIGPYSQAIVAGDFVFCSGQIPLDPETGNVVAGDVSAQVRQVLENLSKVLDASGSHLSKVVRTTIFLKNLEHFAKVNEIYGEYFSDLPPARSTVEVARLPRDVEVEIDAIALIS